MHILHIGTFPYPSPQGSQVYVQGLLKGLRANGHRVSLLCYGHGVGEVQDDIEIIRAPTIAGYHNMRAGPDVIKPFLDATLCYKLLALQPDIIHVHNYEAPIIALLVKFFRKSHRRIPIVYSAHNTMQEELPTYFSGIYKAKLAKGIGTLLDHTIPRLLHHTIVLRENSIDVLQQLGCKRVTCVPPGIEPSEFVLQQPQRIPIELEADIEWIVYAGNPDAYQNIEILCAAMEALPHVGLLFVSASDTSMFTRKNGVVVHIQTHSFAEVLYYISRASLAVVPRMACTGYPMKILNYLAMGVVTICAEGSFIDIPGVIKVPNGDVPKLIDTIVYWLENSEQRLQLSATAKEYIHKNQTIQSQARRLEQVYKTLLLD